MTRRAPGSLYIGLAREVEINVHGQPRHLEVKEVERRPAPEQPPPFSGFVLVQPGEDPEKMEHLLDAFDAETGLPCEPLNISARDHGVSSSEARRRLRGTSRFQREARRPFSRRSM